MIRNMTIKFLIPFLLEKMILLGLTFEKYTRNLFKRNQMADRGLMPEKKTIHSNGKHASISIQSVFLKIRKRLVTHCIFELL